MLQQNRFKENDLMRAEQAIKQQEWAVLNNPNLTAEQKLQYQQQLFNQERGMDRQLNALRQQDGMYRQDIMFQREMERYAW